MNFSREDLKHTREEMLAEVRASRVLTQELKRLKVDENTLLNNVGAFYDYMLALEEVSKCQAAGKCIHSNQYHSIRLEIDAPYVTTHAEVCPLFYQKQQLMSRFIVQDFEPQMLELDVSDLPKRRTFAGFYKQLLAFSNDEVSTVFASGARRLNKLEVAFPFLKRVATLNKEATVGVLNLPKFVREYAGDFYANKSIIDEHVEQFISVDYLIIDGFGNEETNKLIRDAIIFPLVSQRDNLGKKTIYLSEITIRDLHRLYDYTGQDVRSKQIIQTISEAISEELIVSGTEL